ncbi:MAG: alanine racemase [Pseudomonadota bacterium]|nr:alanine racemase [Pseudomonadota bacterium]
MPRPIEALIHRSALRANLQRAKHSAPDARVWAVVKADAYGHGIERAFEGLRGADGFALLDLAEAERLRALDWRGPILLLEGAFEPRDLERCSRLNLWHVVHQAEQIDWLAAHKTHAPHRVFLKLNSGMNRLGFRPDAFRAAHARLLALPQVEEVSLMTHFADADGEADAGSETDRVNKRGIAHQLEVFRTITDDLPGERCLSNSAAMLRHSASAGLHNDWVRAGIVCYGSSPDYPAADIAHWGLQPAMTLRSKLIAVQQLRPGDTVGYGSSYTAPAAQRIGIVACGYADGYPRHCGTGTPVLVNGVRSSTVGRVSMDMLAVDLSLLPQAGCGSEVTLWGRWDKGGPLNAVLAIDEVAQAAGTIGYELMCGLARRVPVQSVD